MPKTSARVCLLLCLCICFATAAGADVEVYKAQHRVAHDLLSIAEVAMDAGGSVTVDGNSNSLVLVGSKVEIAQALALLTRQDQRLRTVLIEHEMRTQRQLDALGVHIRWSAGGDGFRVGNVIAPAGGSGVSIAATARTARGDATQSASLRVLEGNWGRIARGSDWLIPIGTRLDPDTAVVSAESGLEVRPQILGDGRIRLDLRPFQGSFGPGGVVNRSSAETLLVVNPGETVVVGELEQSGDGSSASLLSDASRRREASRQRLLISATIDAQ